MLSWPLETVRSSFRKNSREGRFTFRTLTRVPPRASAGYADVQFPTDAGGTNHSGAGRHKGKGLQIVSRLHKTLRTLAERFAAMKVSPIISAEAAPVRGMQNSFLIHRSSPLCALLLSLV